LILYLLLSLMIEESHSSIALLKVLGYDRKEIKRLILSTFDLPVLIGFLLGIPLLYLMFGRLISSAMQGIDIAMPLRISIWYLMSGMILVTLTYLISRWAAWRKIEAIPMADALKLIKE
jgi:putative ABC transport system permease protein